MTSISEVLKIDKHQIVRTKEILKDYQFLKQLQYNIPSGAKNFDETIGGGFYQGKKYLIFGANKTGKTQLCHQLSIQPYFQSSRLNERSQILHKHLIFYFDTENTFRPERLKEFIMSREVDYNKLLKNIFVSKIMSNSALLLSLQKLESLLERDNVNVLIIDTINNHFNSEIANTKISTNRTKDIFIKILNTINELTIKFNLITITTAQVTSNLIKDTSIKVFPVGNHLLNHFFSEYIYLDYKEHNQRYVQLVNSMSLPEKRLLYKITSSGIQDYKI